METMKRAEDNWPGVYIKGDEAIIMAQDFVAIASWLERNPLDKNCIPSAITILRRAADALSECLAEKEPA